MLQFRVFFLDKVYKYEGSVNEEGGLFFIYHVKYEDVDHQSICMPMKI